MGLEDSINNDRSGGDGDEFEFAQSNESGDGEHQLIGELLDEVFGSGFVESRIKDELDEQFASHGISISKDGSLPATPYSWDATVALEGTWPVAVVEYLLSDESQCDKRYWQATARAAEHLSCSAISTIHKTLTCRTFYESYSFEHEELDNVYISAPPAEVICDILDEIERRLRLRESNIIGQIMNAHDTDICLGQD